MRGGGKARASVSAGLAALLFFSAGASGLLDAAAFEFQGLGARAMGMGNGFVAVSDDYASVLFNPSGIARLKERELYTSYKNLYGLGLLRYISTGYVQPNLGKGAFALSWSRLDTVGDASFLDYAENTIALTYGTYLFKPLYLGVNLKQYRVNSTVGAGGQGVDLGLTYAQDPRWVIGVACQDVSRSEIAWDSGAKDRLPRRLRAGISSRIFSGTLAAAQVDWEDEKDRSEHLGLEQQLFSKVFSVRAGTMEQDGLWRFSFGFGLNFKKHLKLDYGWERQNLLGDSQSFSLGIDF